jgi:CheY-like chemotaxis protein
MTKSILVIEDDSLQAQDLKELLDKAGFTVGRVISTELEFRRQLADLSANEYLAAIVDMMLRWTDPAPDMEMPDPETMREGFYVAGLRCCRRLKERNIPCVIFTALDAANVPQRPDERFKVLNKSMGGDALVEEIRRLC